MKKKINLLTLIVAGVCGLFILTQYIQYLAILDSVVQEEKKRKTDLLDRHKSLAATLLATGEVGILAQYLEDAAKANEIDYYLVKPAKGDPFYYHPGYSYEESYRDFEVGPVLLEGDGQGLLVNTVKLENGTLSVGTVLKRDNRQILDIMKLQRGKLLFSVVISILVTWMATKFGLQDILRFTKSLQSIRPKPMNPSEARSVEGQIILSTAQEQAHQHLRLATSNQALSQSLSPAIRHELEIGSKPPRTYMAAVARVDINGYTQMFLERKSELVTEILNKYFEKANDVITRYRGFVYQYVGDEIVFHFKQDETTKGLSIESLALSAVRGLFEAADEMKSELETKGVPFGVKGSIATGPLQFIKLDQGFAFAGVPLISSVRMLGKIEEREHNTVAMFVKDFSKAESVAVAHKRHQTTFKGFQENQEITEIQNFFPINQSLNEFDKESLAYRRTDRDLTSIFEHIRKGGGHLNPENTRFLLNHVRGIPIHLTNEAVKASFLALLEDALHWPKEGNMILGALVSLAPSLFRGPQDKTQILSVLRQCLSFNDTRVQANAILAMDELSSGAIGFRDYFTADSNRVAADAMLAEGRKEYTPEVHLSLKKLLRSQSDYHAASAVFVFAYLFDHHRRTNPVYFAANRLLAEIPGLIESASARPSERVASSVKRARGLIASRHKASS